MMTRITFEQILTPEQIISFQLDEGVLQLRDAGRQVGLLVKVRPLLLGQVDIGKDCSGLTAFIIVVVISCILKSKNAS
jgi:hypothetical protein